MIDLAHRVCSSYVARFEAGMEGPRSDCELPAKVMAFKGKASDHACKGTRALPFSPNDVHHTAPTHTPTRKALQHNAIHAGRCGTDPVFASGRRGERPRPIYTPSSFEHSAPLPRGICGIGL
jgi:hypothetical protein